MGSHPQSDPVLTSKIRMPSWAVSKRRRYRSSESISAASALLSRAFMPPLIFVLAGIRGALSATCAFFGDSRCFKACLPGVWALAPPGRIENQELDYPFIGEKARFVPYYWL